MIHMCTKFEDDIFGRSIVIMKNVILSFIKEYRETMTSSLWKYFFLHNLGWTFHCWCQIEAVFYIWTFSKWPPFWGRKEFFTWSDTGIWICYNDGHEHLWHFELFIDALAQILTELLEFKVLTYFGTLWRHQWSNPRSFVKAYLQFNDI